MEERRVNLIEVDKVKMLLSIAQQDLESSKILLDCKKYSNSVWDFSQSVEKATKCEALMSGEIKYDELKGKIRHSPFNFIKSQIEKNFQDAQKMEEAIKKYPEIKEIPAINNIDLVGFKENAKFAKEVLTMAFEKKLMISDNLNDLDVLITEIYKIIQKTEQINTDEISKQHFQVYKDAWTSSIKAYIELSEKQGRPIDKTEQDNALKLSDENLKTIVDNVRANLVLTGLIHTLNANLSILVAPHFEYLRYPDSKNPLDYYTEDNPLIKRFDKLIDIQRKNIELHKEFLEIIERRMSKYVSEKE